MLQFCWKNPANLSVVGCLVGMVMVLYIIISIAAAQNGVAAQIFKEENQPDIRDCLPASRNVIQNLDELVNPASP